MKLMILAGGLGTRISEESHLRPKPMIEIGGKPILWHIMKIYSSFGIDEFIVCCGYRGYQIKEYFFNYSLHMSDVTFNMEQNSMHVHSRNVEPWKVTLVDTGESTMTGGRLRRAAPYLDGDDTFCMTYGDGVGDVDIEALLAFHRAHGKLATLTVVPPPARFGALEVESTDEVVDFREKPDDDGGLINAGFFVLSRKVIDYIDGDQTTWERGPMERLASERELKAYRHRSFWQPMDTLRDKTLLEELWASGRAPWKTWS
jgi:glucose-1-phosphate cytidylyltransferase